MQKFDNQKSVEWYSTAQELAKLWTLSMRQKSHVSLNVDDIEFFLEDLWFKRESEDPIFKKENRGRLYNYTLKYLSHSRDCLSGAQSYDDERVETDRLDYLAAPLADDAVEERAAPLAASAPLDKIFNSAGLLAPLPEDGEEDEPADTTRSPSEDCADPTLEQLRAFVELDGYLDRLDALSDQALTAETAAQMGVTSRRARSLLAEVRQEKAAALMREAARARGVDIKALRVLAAKIVENAGAAADADALKRFAETFGVGARSPVTAKRAKKRKPAALAAA